MASSWIFETFITLFYFILLLYTFLFSRNHQSFVPLCPITTPEYPIYSWTLAVLWWWGSHCIWLRLRMWNAWLRSLPAWHFVSHDRSALCLWSDSQYESPSHRTFTSNKSSCQRQPTACQGKISSWWVIKAMDIAFLNIHFENSDFSIFSAKKKNYKLVFIYLENYSFTISFKIPHKSMWVNKFMKLVWVIYMFIYLIYSFYNKVKY